MSLGEKCKKFERVETDQRFVPGVPLYIRIDGRGFSKFTQGMKRPFDPMMSQLMMQTTVALMKEFDCVLGYTQSDEISLVIDGNANGGIPFDGKKQKLVSSMAAFASSYFALNAMTVFPAQVDRKFPTFDCRIFNAPKNEVVENLIWRHRDALKNSHSMAARAQYSHSALEGKTSKDKKEMLLEKGIVFEEYPLYFREGTFFKRVFVEREMSDEVWDKIPDKHKPNSRKVIRVEIEDCQITDFETLPSKEKFVFRKYLNKEDEDV